MEDAELTECFEYVKELVRQCGVILNDGIKNCGQIDSKGHYKNVVTEFDRKIENILIDEIKIRYPNHKFIAEEESAVSDQNQATLTNDPTWIIDPIDGTINFVNHIGFVAISVALSINQQLELAILYNPCKNEFYTARRNHGAFLNGEQIFTNKNENLKFTLSAWTSMNRQKAIERYCQYNVKTIGIRAFGSVALTLAYVAQGLLGVYLVENMKPWDVAAGILLIQEATGIVTNVDGRPIDLMRPNIVCAGNQKLLQQIYDIEKEISERTGGT